MDMALPLPLNVSPLDEVESGEDGADVIQSAFDSQVGLRPSPLLVTNQVHSSIGQLDDTLSERWYTKHSAHN